MSVALLQLILLLVACGGLFLLWRAAAKFPKPLGVIVTVGFLVRAIAAQILFWISYMEWPFLERLQLGSGFWFFAADGLEYFRKAVEAAGSGPLAILQYTRTAPSVAYVQALATGVYAFGTSPFVGILLNLACYLATCLIVLRWSSLAPKSATPAAIAIAAISLSPSSILWALQPLKDAFFIFLTVGFIGVCVAWQRAWRGAPGLARAATASAVGMLVFMYALAAVRWYFATVVLAACALFLVLVVIAAPGRRRLGAIVAAAVVLLLLPRSLLLGAGPYVPDAIRNVLTPSTFFTSSKALPKSLTNNLNDLRGGFERTGGATTIALGSNFEKAEKAAGTAVVVQVPTTRALPNARRKKSRPRPARESEQRTAQQEEEIQTADASDAVTDEASTEQADEAVSGGAAASGPGSETSPVSHASSESTHAQPKPATGSPSSHAPVMTSASSAPASSRPAQQPASPASTHPATSQPASHASASKPQTQPAPQPAPAKTQTPSAASQAAASKPHTPPAEAVSTPTTPAKSAGAEVQTDEQHAKQSPAQQAQEETTSRREPATKPAEPVRRASSKQPSPPQKSVAPAPKLAVPAAPAPTPEPAVAVVQSPPVVAPAPPPVVKASTESSASEGSSESQAMILPQSVSGRVVAGTVAVVMPRSIAQKLGLLKMSGGRGLWLLADVDTLAFDALLIATFVMLIRRRRGLMPTNPVSWLVLGATVMITVPLVYTVSNFGTLFRLREMIFIGLALVPLALSTIAVESDKKSLAREAEPVHGGDTLPVAPETT